MHIPKKVFYGRIIPFILIEILTKCFSEILFLHEIEKLLHSCSSFWVSYSIKNGVSNTGVGHFSPDGMCSYHHIFMISPSFSLKERCHSRLIFNSFTPVFYFLKTEVRDEIRKAFIKPQIVPPFHCDKISEPVMWKLMRNGICKIEHSLSRNFFLKNIEVIKSDNSSIFHCSPLVLVSKYLIILVKRKGKVEEVFEESHGLDCYFKDEGGKFFHVLV